MTDLTAEIPPELFARLAHPTVLARLRVEAKAAVLLVKPFPAVIMSSVEFCRRGLLGLG